MPAPILPEAPRFNVAYSFLLLYKAAKEVGPPMPSRVALVDESNALWVEFATCLFRAAMPVWSSEESDYFWYGNPVPFLGVMPA